MPRHDLRQVPLRYSIDNHPQHAYSLKDHKLDHKENSITARHEGVKHLKHNLHDKAIARHSLRQTVNWIGILIQYSQAVYSEAGQPINR